MTTTKRAPLALRREALLALCAIIGVPDHVEQTIRDATHSECDMFEAVIAAGLSELGADLR